MKEALNSPYNKIIFRETFNDEATVRRNGGTPTNVVFENGKGIFNGNILYNLTTNGVYSVRIKCKTQEFINQILIDFRGDSGDGTGFIQSNVTTGTITRSSGTVYINGTAGTSLLLNQWTDLVVTGIILNLGTGNNITVLGAYFNGTALKFVGEMDLVEIYQGTLTASEVKNLYENKWNKEVSGYGGQLSPNLIKNNQFENWTGGIPDEWSLSGTVSATNYLEQVSNGLRVVSDGSLLGVTQNALTIGKPYNVIIDVEINSGSGYIRIGDSATNQYTLTEGVNMISVKSVDNTLIAIRRQAACDILIKSITVQELQPDLLLDFDSTRGTLSDKTVGNTVGTPIINNNLDFTSGWTGLSTTNIATNSFTTSASGGIYKSLLTVGKRYRVHIKGSTTSTGFFFNNNSTGITKLTGNFDSVQEFTQIAVSNLYMRNDSAGTTTITYLQVEEIQPALTPTDVSIKKIGQSYSADFNGTTSKIDTGSDFIGTKAVTVCGWFRYRTGQIQPRMIDNGRFSASVVLVGNTLNVTSDNYTSNPVSKAGAILINTWQFIAITRSVTGVVNIYIGDLSNAPTLSGTADQSSGTPVAGTTNVIIGNNSATTRTFDGLIPKLKVVEGILSLADITREWSSTRNEIN